MNYQKIYTSIIEYRKTEVPNEGYCETHHIIPKSVGGSNNSNNLVILTAREHFICHLLLVKIYENTPNYYKMVKAFFMMQTESKNQNRHITSRKYSKLKKELSKIKSAEVLGPKNPNYGRVWCVLETAVDCKGMKSFPNNSIPEGWITTKELKKRLKKIKISNKAKSKAKAKDMEMRSKLTEWYNLYSSVGFDKFVEITGYKYSKQNLVQRFVKWVPTFVPQNGKKRGLN